MLLLRLYRFYMPCTLAGVRRRCLRRYAVSYKRLERDERLCALRYKVRARDWRIDGFLRRIKCTLHGNNFPKTDRRYARCNKVDRWMHRVYLTGCFTMRRNWHDCVAETCLSIWAKFIRTRRAIDFDALFIFDRDREETG